MINKYPSVLMHPLLEDSILKWFFPVWLSAQEPMYNVKRWGGINFNDNGNICGLRQQSTLEHVHSFSLFVDVAIAEINKYIIAINHNKLNYELIHRCCLIHDHSEGLLNKDIKDYLKTDENDLLEYTTFMEHIRNFSSSIQHQYRYAFLLQFATMNAECFAEKERETMSSIMKNNFYEALAFKAFERFEYLFSPIEKVDRDPDLLASVIRNQISYYKIYIKKLPGFREEIFTEQVENWMLEYLEKHPVKILV